MSRRATSNGVYKLFEVVLRGMRRIILWPGLLLCFMIFLYQKTLSPDHSWLKRFYPYGYCRFYPTCSEYSKQSIENAGVFQGLYLSVKRILRCNPCSVGGIDEPPKKH